MKSRFLSLLVFGCMLIAGLSSVSAFDASCGCEAQQPACCEPSCDPCCCRPGLLSRLHGRLACLKSRLCCKPSCCEESCCEAAAPTCGCDAAPACAAPAAPTCGCDAAPACDSCCEDSCNKCCRVSLCDRIKARLAARRCCCKTSCCETSCCKAEPTCGCN